MLVYLDNAATTPIASEVIDAMLPILKGEYGNPSSMHSFGRNAKALIEVSRRSIARHLNCKPSEIIFTSGGTEADNMALHSAVNQMGAKQIVTSRLEHHAIGNTLNEIEKSKKARISYVKVDKKGTVDLEDLERLIDTEDKTLVCLMHANNEIATLLPLDKVSTICRKHKALLLSDTVQTLGHYHIDLKQLDIDFITGAAHKFHGPKGIGFLYVNKNAKVEPLIYGGLQERGHRSGTENVYGIAGLSKAMDLAYENLEEHQKHVQGLKTYMINELKKEFEDISFYGDIDPDRSLYTILNVCFPATSKSSMLLFTLDLKGVAVSGGSACSSGAAVGSHVLTGIGADMTRPNVRFSFSRYTTLDEIDYALEQIKIVFEKTLA
jgi:cysteine desulfurase